MPPRRVRRTDTTSKLPLYSLDDLMARHRSPSPVDETRAPHNIGYWTAFAALGALTLWSITLLFHSERVAGLIVAVPAFYGFIAMWRHSWAGLHLLRAAIYLRAVFPRLARKARALGISQRVPHVSAVVTSYNIPPAQFRAVYEALFRNLLDYGAPATIVAAITTDRDRMLLEDVVASFGFPSQIEVVAQFQRGDGKRGALAMALRCLARRELERGSVTIFLDGDVVIEEGALKRSLPFFLSDARLGAITTNNDAVTEGNALTRSWYSLRYAQRHVLMSSLSLSGRLLVLTGRFSLYRSEEVVRSDFIDLIENDGMRDWLHGEFRFLTGDDKSAWYALLKRDVRMLYLPDVKAVGFEALPAGCGFAAGSTRLMHRWFGNMLRSNSRALHLGPVACGPFPWLCILDQRVSMWTSLMGPVLAVVLSLTISPAFFLYYLAWVLLSRLVMSALEGAVWGRFEPLWPFLLAYDQIWGALLKTHLQFRLNRQSWTRQGIASGTGTITIEGTAAGALHVLAMTGLVVAVCMLAGR